MRVDGAHNLRPLVGVHRSSLVGEIDHTYYCYHCFADCDGDDLGSESLHESTRSCADKSDYVKRKRTGIEKERMSDGGY